LYRSRIRQNAGASAHPHSGECGYLTLELQGTARSARRYDLYLPLTDNDGRPFAAEQFDAVERRLVARFGGLTSLQRQSPLRGIWQGETRLYFDQVIIMTVLDFRRQGSTRFIAQLKQALLREFEQLEILITEQPLRVH
jgi:hypothetical protein